MRYTNWFVAQTWQLVPTRAGFARVPNDPSFVGDIYLPPKGFCDFLPVARNGHFWPLRTPSSHPYNEPLQVKPIIGFFKQAENGLRRAEWWGYQEGWDGALSDLRQHWNVTPEISAQYKFTYGPALGKFIESRGYTAATLKLAFQIIISHPPFDGSETWFYGGVNTWLKQAEGLSSGDAQFLLKLAELGWIPQKRRLENIKSLIKKELADCGRTKATLLTSLVEVLNLSL